jgi:hypothetical protein
MTDTKTMVETMRMRGFPEHIITDLFEIIPSSAIEPDAVLEETQADPVDETQ